MTVELPKDADGREIPPDTKRLCDGVPVGIRAFRHNPNECLRRAERSDGSGTPKTTEPRSTAPDGREKPEEDSDKRIEAGDSRRYYRIDGICARCTRPDDDGGGCAAAAFRDIEKRIRELRGEDW